MSGMQAMMQVANTAPAPSAAEAMAEAMAAVTASAQAPRQGPKQKRLAVSDGSLILMTR
jgi:hypothetical protein